MIKIIDDRCGGDSCEEQKKLYEELKIKRQEKQIKTKSLRHAVNSQLNITFAF